MASFEWTFPDGQKEKDAAVVKEMFGDNPSLLDLPDHSEPFILGKYKAYPGEVPEWDSDYIEAFKEASFPPERVLFDKLWNTRLPEDAVPQEYDDMVYRMELLVRNSPYREGVFQKQYSNEFLMKIQRPDYISSVINQKTGAAVSLLYNFVTDYVPSLPGRFFTFAFERVPARWESFKLSRREFAHASPDSKLVQYKRGVTNAWDVVKPFDLEGTTAIVTGSSSGIGKEVARSLASRGATLILPSRDIPACDQMALQWRTEFSNPAIHCAQCNLANMDSVINFLGELKQQRIVPDLLVNAAAVLKPFITSSHTSTANIAIGTNLLSHMVLTDGIIGLMDADLSVLPPAQTPSPPHPLFEHISSALYSSPKSSFTTSGTNSNIGSSSSSPNDGARKVRRIVNLTCDAYKHAALRSEEITVDGLGALTGVRAYNVSKLGNVAHAQHLAQWLERTNRSPHIVINSIDPGLTYDTRLFENTFLKYWQTRIGRWLRSESVQSPEVAAAPVLRLLLDPATRSSNGLHYKGYDVVESPLSLKSAKWKIKFLNAMEDLKERAIDKTVEHEFMQHLKLDERQKQKELNPKLKEMREWYTKQSEQFERSLDLPMPEMMPGGFLELRPPPPHESIGSKPLGIGPPDAPLIGEDLKSNWHNITDTYPVQIQELVRRRDLVIPKPSAEEQAQIDQTKAEFEALKRQIMYERRLKSQITSQYGSPTNHISNHNGAEHHPVREDEDSPFKITFMSPGNVQPSKGSDEGWKSAQLGGSTDADGDALGMQMNAVLRSSIKQRATGKVQLARPRTESEIIEDSDEDYEILTGDALEALLSSLSDSELLVLLGTIDDAINFQMTDEDGMPVEDEEDLPIIIEIDTIHHNDNWIDQDKDDKHTKKSSSSDTPNRHQ